MSLESLRSVVVSALVACAFSELEQGLAGQAEETQSAEIGEGDVPRDRIVLEGNVVAPDGTPEEGALVFSSAGGRAVTNAAGSYRLEVDVPRNATSVQVTAVGGEQNLAKSTSVAPWRTAQATPVETLQLELGTPCSPSWLPTFGSAPGTSDSVEAFIVWDDGSGPALYLGGSFPTVGGMYDDANHIVKWDGSAWSLLGSGTGNHVHALAVYDDGNGLALYAGGTFITAGGVAANRVAKWDGSVWSALGSGIQGGGTQSSVSALTVYDDGSGSALYAGGTFTTAGGGGREPDREVGWLELVGSWKWDEHELHRPRTGGP